MNHLKFNSRSFWFRVFDSLPSTEKTGIGGYDTFRIPFHEAVCFCQLLRPKRERILQPSPTLLAHENEKEETVIIPPTCAPLNTPHPELGSETQLNPLFAPSLSYISEKFPNFFQKREKFLAICESGSDFNKKEIREAFIEGNHHISQLLIFDMDPGWSSHDSGIGANQAYVSEPIMEYLASVHFRNAGYIVDKFSERLSSSRKNLDLFAIRCPDLQNVLTRHNIGSPGLYLCELETPLWEEKEHKLEDLEGENISVVIEAESSRNSESSGYSQLKTDLNSGEFNHGYVSAPFIKGKDREDMGMVTFDTDGSLYAEVCPKNHADEEKKPQLLERVKRIVKLALLKNIPLSKTLHFLPQVNTFWEVYTAVEKVSLERVIKLVKKIELKT